MNPTTCQCSCTCPPTFTGDYCQIPIVPINRTYSGRIIIPINRLEGNTKLKKGKYNSYFVIIGFRIILG